MRDEREERIQRVLDSLVDQRQALRRIGADEVSLAASSLAIAYWQQQLLRRTRPAQRGTLDARDPTTRPSRSAA